MKSLEMGLCILWEFGIFKVRELRKVHYNKQLLSSDWSQYWSWEHTEKSDQFLAFEDYIV